MDQAVQVHKILLKYIIYKQKVNRDAEVVVKLLKLIFNMALSEFNRSYTLRLSDKDD